MRITELRAENIKRLKAVDITPDNHLQIIGGRNAQGKSSVLDAVALALTGKEAKKLNPRPLRDGERSGKVTLKLDGYVVTRTFTAAGGGTLTVTASDSKSKLTSPQRVLDDLMGRLSFDPQEFIGLSAREQSQALLSLVDLDIDLDATDETINSLSQERLVKGRELKAKGDYLPFSPDIPVAERSATDLLDLIQSHRDRNREIEDANSALRAAQHSADELADHIADLQSQLKSKMNDVDRYAARVVTLGPILDTTAHEKQLSDIENSNARIRTNRENKRHNTEIDAAKNEYEQLTTRIEELRATKDKALAEAKFPIDGLGFDDSGVTYNGVPFSQASSMEQLRVSMAIAMASNPKLRVIRIKDGSLLDDDALALVASEAKANDYQVLMERVGDKDPGAIIIEDGQVKETA